MINSDTVLIILTCLVGTVCIIAVQIKKGIIIGSVWSQLGKDTKIYSVRNEKRKLYYTYLGIALAAIILIALVFMRDLESMAIFAILNVLSIRYFLNYFVLLEPKERS